MQAISRAPSFFSGVLVGLTGEGSSDRRPSMSETRLDASTSLGYQLSELPEAHELGVLEEVFGQPQASIVKGYASQPLQLYEAGEGSVMHLTMDSARPEKKDGDDLRYQQLCEEPGAVPAGDGLVHLPVPGIKPGV